LDSYFSEILFLKNPFFSVVAFCLSTKIILIKKKEEEKRKLSFDSSRSNCICSGNEKYTNLEKNLRAKIYV